MKKNIAIIHNLPPGGGLRMLSEVIKRYCKQCNIDMFVISQNKPEIIKHTNLSWFPVKPLKGFLSYNFWVIFVLPQIHRDIAQKVDWSKYDLVFASHDYFTKSPYIFRYIKSKQIIYLCQEAQREFYEPSFIHAPNIKDKIANLIRYPIKLIDERNVSYVSKIICNSEFSKGILKKIYNKVCEVVYPGVNIKMFRPSTEKKENTIISIGGINKVKGQEFIIESLRPLLKKYKLMLFGNGRKEDIEKIQNIIEGLNIEIKKYVDDKTLVRYYSKAKVTCIAAYNEPFGLSSIESQACGTPVVAIDNGGPKETIINGVNGHLSCYNNKEYLIKVKEAIMRNKVMGKKGIENVRNNWTWNHTLKPLDKYFMQ